MAQRRGVIFDMDGVLVASGPVHRASWQALARKHGIELSDDAFADSFGRTSRDIVRTMWGDQISSEEVQRYDSQKEAIYRDLITGMIPLTIGVREVLSALSGAGYSLAVATSGPRENLDMVLDETNLRGCFAAVVHGFDVKHGKPAPDAFLLAAKRCNLEPADCVVVEDAPVGIQAGVAADMPVIGLVGTHPAERLREAGVACVVDRLADITPELVSNLLQR